MKKFYVMIHVIKHDMDPNSNKNYRRKIGPVIAVIQATTVEDGEKKIKKIGVNTK